MDQDKAYYAVCESVKAFSEKKVEECCQLIRGLKPVKATSVQKLEEGKDPEGVAAPEDADEDLPCSTSPDNNCNSMSIGRPAKRMRKTSMEVKRCSATGCQKTHFWSKKWNFCPNCNKNFCSSHADAFYQHKC